MISILALWDAKHTDHLGLLARQELMQPQATLRIAILCDGAELEPALVRP
jgi:hypothetical protein